MARRRRREPPGPSGFLVVDKPRGRTSHDVVEAARRWLGTRRVGHLGTLDPQATGVLPLAVRDATKLIPFVEGGVKEYAGSIHLGIRTDTLDGDGEVVERFEGALPEEAAVREALGAFEGEILQVPPMYSAVKRGGVPLHRLARRGEEVEREARPVRVHRFALASYAPPRLEIEVVCEAGTYVRVLAGDLGEALGCGAFLESLRRTRSGPFPLEQAVPFDSLERDAEVGKAAEHLLAMPRVLETLGWTVLTLGDEDAGRIAHGMAVPIPRVRVPEGPGARVAAVDPQGALLAVMELRPDWRLQPLRVLASAG